MTDLRYLNLDRSAITGKLQNLQNLTKLETLRLRHTAITGKLEDLKVPGWGGFESWVHAILLAGSMRGNETSVLPAPGRHKRLGRHRHAAQVQESPTCPPVRHRGFRAHRTVVGETAGAADPGPEGRGLRQKAPSVFVLLRWGPETA